MFAMAEAAAREDERQIARGMLAGRHAAAKQNGGVVEQRAAAQRIRLGLEQFDQARHPGDLAAFNQFERGDFLLPLAVMGKAVVAAAESKVAVGETRRERDGPRRIGLDRERDQFDHRLHIGHGSAPRSRLGAARRRFRFVDPWLLQADLLFQRTDRVEILGEFALILFPEPLAQRIGLFPDHIQDAAMPLHVLFRGGFFRRRFVDEQGSVELSQVDRRHLDAGPGETDKIRFVHVQRQCGKTHLGPNPFGDFLIDADVSLGVGGSVHGANAA